MNALTTALRVLRWALEGAAGPAPGGPLRRTASLIDPGREVRDALSELVRRHAARTGTGRPPLGDAAPPGAGAVLLASAIGGRGEPEAARAVAQAVAPPQLSTAGDGGWSDAVARHAVVTAYASALPLAPAASPGDPLLDPLLDASPLTAVLHRPSAPRLSQGAAGPVRTAASLLERPHGRAVLCATLASWSASALVLDWRSHLLGRLVTDHPEAVADTYLAARLRHGARWDELLHSAGRRMAGREPPDDLTLATVRFWAPLDTLDRNQRARLAVRPYLEGHQPALRLVRRYRLTTPTFG